MRSVDNKYVGNLYWALRGPRDVVAESVGEYHGESKRPIASRLGLGVHWHD